MKGGRFGLVPSVPVNDQLEILTEENAKPNVVALFTDGNMKDMRVQTLTPEDRKAFEAEILWRKEYKNKFPETRTTNVRFENYPSEPIETYDMTQFCTSRKQTVQFGKFALAVRKWIDHTIEFETTPESAAGIEPADYIRVVSHVCHPDRFQNGCVTSDGRIVSSRPIPNGTQVYYWRLILPSPRPTAQSKRVQLATTKPQASPTPDSVVASSVASLIPARTGFTRSTRLGIGEEGFVQITASHMPVTSTGALQIMQDWADTGSGRGFVVNEGDE